MKKLLPFVAAMTISGAATAELPLFSAKCTPGLNIDSDTKGRVYINGMVAKLINRPNGQITARSEKTWIDITPEGDQPPYITYTAKDKTTGVCEILSYKQLEPTGQGNRPSSAERAGQGQFDATGNIPCAQYKGQPMNQCPFGVARDGYGGTATVMVTLPDGRKRAIFFENGKAISADLSQADGNMEFHVTKEADLFIIRAGDGRYEIPEAVIFGG